MVKVTEIIEGRCVKVEIFELVSAVEGDCEPGGGGAPPDDTSGGWLTPKLAEGDILLIAG
jgi:hypothetical protein